MNEQLQLVIELQKIDSQILKLKQQKAEIEKIVAQLLKKVKQSEEALEKDKKALQTTEKEKHRQEMEIKVLEEEIKKYTKQSFEVKSNKEYAALQKEISDRKEKIGDIETEIILALEREEEIRAEIAELKKELEKKRREAVEVERKLLKEIKEVEENITQCEGEKKRMAAKMDKEIFSTYERLITSPQKNGLAVVEMKEGFCQGCFVSLPPQRVNEVKRNSEIIFCEGCGRILYWAEGSSS